MNRNTIFIIVLCLSVALAAIDFISNGYLSKLNLKASVQEITKETAEENAYLKKLQEVDSEIELKSQTEGQTIFNKIDTTKVDFIKKTTEFLFTKSNVNYLRLYTFDFEVEQGQINYLKIKNIFNELSKEHSNIAINEVNNYGINSFYVNDTKDEEMARIVVLTEKDILAVEYAKTINKESVEPLLSTLTGNIEN